MSNLGFSFGVNTGEGDAPEAPKLSPLASDTLPELPLRLVVVGDFRGAPASRDGRRVHAGLGFNEAMAAMDVEVHLQVQDRLRKPGEPLNACIKSTSLKELRPSAVAAQVPGLSEAVGVLKKVAAADAGKGSRTDAVKAAEALEGFAGLRPALTNLRGSPKSTPAAKATGGGKHNCLAQKQAEHLASPRAQRPDKSDFTGALVDRDGHDSHDTDGAHQ